jgi:small conductance mechanosensitive channel
MDEQDAETATGSTPAATEAAAAAPGEGGGANPLSLVRQEVEWVTTAYQTVVDFLVTYSFQLLGAILIMAAGVLVANRVSRLVLDVQARRNVDVTLRQFVASVVRVIVLVGFAIIAVEKIGISIGPFLAAIGGLALGASFALQLPISNYGAGLVIILTRPFKVGDTIRIIDQWGVVDDISLALTTLTNEDDESIVIPNKHLIGEVLINSHASRIVEGVVGIAYGDAPEKAVEVIRAVLEADPDVTSDPPPQVGIQAFGDSAVEIGYRYWVPTRRYFELQYRVNLAVWNALGDAGLTIPFPQRDVHLIPVAGDRPA